MSAQGQLSAATLEQALALAGVGCWSWQDGALRVSANFAGLLGCTPEELPVTPDDWLARTHADERASLAALLAGLASHSSQGLSNFSLRLRHASGLWQWFDVRIAHQPDPDGAQLVTFNENTQQKQAEAALRDSQLRFRALYNTSPLACLVWDREGRISEWNQRAEHMFGWPAGEVIGQTVHRLLLPTAQHPAFSETVRGMIRGSGDGIFSGPALTRDDRQLESTWYNVALRAPNGQLLGILSLVLDITDERRALQRVEKSEKVYRALVETSPDAILLLDLEGRLQMANQQAHRLFGLDELEDLAATRIADLLPAGSDDADFLKQREEFTGFIANRQLQMQSRGGRTFDAATAFTTIMNAEGDATGIVLFVRDITEQLRIDRELAAHRANLEQLIAERTVELARARDSLSQIIDGSPVPTFVLDTGHVVTHWNKACEEITGLPASQMIGTCNHSRAFYATEQPLMADLVMLGEKARLDAVYDERYQAAPTVNDGYQAKRYFPHLNRWLFFTAAPLRDQHGQLLGAIETLQDITQREMNEIALIQAKRAAEAATEAKAAFLANMSHEIRTPMNAVIGLAHLLLKDDLNPRQRDYLSRIHGAGQLLLGLINDILDYSKIEAGRMQLESIPFRLDEVLDNVASVLLHRVQEKGLELQYVIAPEVPANLRGDPLRLAQILINLVGNAIKFTASGAITVHIRRQPGNDAEHLRLEVDVQDTGIGMSPEQQKSLFEAFSQGDTSITRKYGGTGLGLTICKRLCELMRGEIWVTSHPGVGSTFSFTVHLGIGEAEPATLPSGLRRALVVDDNPLARSILVRLLATQGYAAIAAESGEQALHYLEEARNAPFELVSIDLNMPGMDGIELARAIQERFSPVPRLIMVTAADTTGQAQLEPFAAVLHKPVTAAQLGQVLNGFRAPATVARPAELAGLRALLVDDLPTNLLIASELLESFGITVDTAENGVEALHKLIDREQAYDLVLMDIQMPEMDGLEATRRLRASQRWPKLPIIAMTAHALASERQRCLEAGMNDFLTKPIEPEQLHKTLLAWRPAKPPAPPCPPQPVVSATSADGLPDLPGINKADGLRRMLNKPKLYEKVLRDFHARFINEAAQIKAGIAAGDLATSRRRAHTTKGLAGTIGADDLQAAALALEQALTQEQPDAALVERFASELARILTSIGNGFGIGAD